MKVIEYLLERSFQLCMIALLIVLLAVYSYINTPSLLAPRTRANKVLITVMWPGVMASQVDNYITLPIVKINQ